MTRKYPLLLPPIDNGSGYLIINLGLSAGYVVRIYGDLARPMPDHEAELLGKWIAVTQAMKELDDLHGVTTDASQRLRGY